MRVEAGSMNLSRIPGIFAYPARSYRNSPVEEVASVDTIVAKASPSELRHLAHGVEGLERPEGELETGTISDSLSVPYKDPSSISSRRSQTESAERGLVIDIYG